MTEYIGLTIAPQQSVFIPVKVTRTSNSQARAMTRHIDDDPCVGYPGTLYYWDCGEDRKWHRYGIAMQLGTCKSNDSSTWGGGSSGGGGSGSGVSGGSGLSWLGTPSGGSGSYYNSSSQSNNVSTSQDKGCEPCQNGISVAGAKCAQNFIGDPVKTLQAIMGLDADFDNDEEPSDRDILDGLYDLLESVASTFDTCVGASPDFDGVYKCYKKASETVDNLFDDAVEAALGSVISPDKLKKYKSIGKKILKWKKWIDIAADCANEFVHACDHLKEDNDVAHSRNSRGSEVVSFINDVQNHLELARQRMEALAIINNYLWGDESSWDEVSFGEMEVLLNDVDYVNMTNSELIAYKPESISNSVFETFCNRMRTYMVSGMPKQQIDDLISQIQILKDTHRHFIDLGYDTPSDYMKVQFVPPLHFNSSRRW